MRTLWGEVAWQLGGAEAYARVVLDDERATNPGDALRGREALDRPRNVVGRVEAAWRPASAEEEFEIVRRWLFEPLTADALKQRDMAAHAFAEF